MQLIKLFASGGAARTDVIKVGYALSMYGHEQGDMA